jgi:two-component system LytT family response regulator
MVRYLIVDDEAPGRANLRLALAAHPDWQLACECDSAAAARTALAAQDRRASSSTSRCPRIGPGAGARDQPPARAAADRLRDRLQRTRGRRLRGARARLSAQAAGRCAPGPGRGAHRRRCCGSASAKPTAPPLRDYVDAGAARPCAAERINVRSVGRIEQIRVSDILWIESAGNYVELHLAGRTVLHRITLNRLEALLRRHEFLRVHRSAIVRRDQIARLETSRRRQLQAHAALRRHGGGQRTLPGALKSAM